MKNIKNLRKKIDHVDKKMQVLFEKRMHTVSKISDYKKEHHLGVSDFSREEEMKENLVNNLKDINLTNYYLDFLSHNIELSKEYQQEQTAKRIVIGENNLYKVREVFNIYGKVLVVSESGIPTEYIKQVSGGTNVFNITLPTGEVNKNFDNVKLILDELYNHEFTRNDSIIVVGGGMICDIGNFAASVYMRGIKCYLCPTTILAAVDASIGGKTAVNFNKAKNQIGSFHKPAGVLIDVSTFKTLPIRIYNEGMAEIIKIAAIRDNYLFEHLENDDLSINEIISRAIVLKEEIVALDYKEEHLRMCLNFGHTLGHVIEASSAGTLLHGESVAAGMVYASTGDAKIRIINLLKQYNLPTDIKINLNDLETYLIHDKKRNNELYNFIEVSEIGNYQIKQLTFDEIKELIKEQ